MEHVASMENSHKLFHVILATIRKALGVSEMICEADDLPIYNQQRRLLHWTEHFQKQFSWPSASAPAAVILAGVRWPGTTDLPTEAEIISEIIALGDYKMPDSDVFPSASFKGKEMELVRELQLKFSKVW